MDYNGLRLLREWQTLSIPDTLCKVEPQSYKIYGEITVNRILKHLKYPSTRQTLYLTYANRNSKLWYSDKVITDLRLKHKPQILNTILRKNYKEQDILTLTENLPSQ
jgi:transposase